MKCIMLLEDNIHLLCINTHIVYTRKKYNTSAVGICHIYYIVQCTCVVVQYLSKNILLNVYTLQKPDRI